MLELLEGFVFLFILALGIALPIYLASRFGIVGGMTIVHGMGKKHLNDRDGAPDADDRRIRQGLAHGSLQRDDRLSGAGCGR